MLVDGLCRPWRRNEERKMNRSVCAGFAAKEKPRSEPVQRTQPIRKRAG